jgi:hypothetical protein
MATRSKASLVRVTHQSGFGAPSPFRPLQSAPGPPSLLSTITSLVLAPRNRISSPLPFIWRRGHLWRRRHSPGGNAPPLADARRLSLADMRCLWRTILFACFDFSSLVLHLSSFISHRSSLILHISFVLPLSPASPPAALPTATLAAGVARPAVELASAAASARHRTTPT